MMKFAARTAIVLIGGVLMLSQLLLCGLSISTGDWGWVVVAMVNSVALGAMTAELWDRTSN